MNNDTTELLAELERRGVRLELDGAGRLRYRAPRGALTAELRDLLAACKAQLVAALECQGRGKSGHFDGPILAALVESPTLGPVWLLEPRGLDIMPSTAGVPWFLLSEVPNLNRRDSRELRRAAAERCGAPARLQ